MSISAMIITHKNQTRPHQITQEQYYNLALYCTFDREMQDEYKTVQHAVYQTISRATPRTSIPSSEPKPLLAILDDVNTPLNVDTDQEQIFIVEAMHV